MEKRFGESLILNIKKLRAERANVKPNSLRVGGELSHRHKISLGSLEDI